MAHFPKKAAAASHRRSKVSITEWNQFATANRLRHLNGGDFNAHPHTRPAYEQSIHPYGHPAHSSNVRRLVTYPSTNNTHKECEYGTYRDGQVVKCLRNPHHAPAGASHKRGAHTGNPMGHPRGHVHPGEEEDEDEEEEEEDRPKKRKKSPSVAPVATERRSTRGKGGLNLPPSSAANSSSIKPNRETRRLAREKGWK